MTFHQSKYEHASNHVNKNETSCLISRILKTYKSLQWLNEKKHIYHFIKAKEQKHVKYLSTFITKPNITDQLTNLKCILVIA